VRRDFEASWLVNIEWNHDREMTRICSSAGGRSTGVMFCVFYWATSGESTDGIESLVIGCRVDVGLCEYRGRGPARRA
jgi:hypothetical protein